MDESLESLWTPGWDKVDQLADALVELQGLSVTNAQAVNIKSLDNALVDYDKQPIKYRPMFQRDPRGRFGRKYKTGHVGVETLKR